MLTGSELEWVRYHTIGSKVVNHLADAWNEFLLLPEWHGRNREEFMYAIHAAQNIVMASLYQQEHMLAPLLDPDDDMLTPSPEIAF